MVFNTKTARGPEAFQLFVQALNASQDDEHVVASPHVRPHACVHCVILQTSVPPEQFKPQPPPAHVTSHDLAPLQFTEQLPPGQSNLQVAPSVQSREQLPPVALSHASSHVSPAHAQAVPSTHCSLHPADTTVPIASSASIAIAFVNLNVTFRYLAEVFSR